MEELMKKLIVVAALAFALTGAAANVVYAGPCGDANCSPPDSKKSAEATKPKADKGGEKASDKTGDKESCSQPNCRNDERDEHRQAAKAAAKEAAQAATRAIFEVVKARSSSRRSRDEDEKQSN
jgi:hypothetical protein